MKQIILTNIKSKVDFRKEEILRMAWKIVEWDEKFLWEDTNNKNKYLKKELNKFIRLFVDKKINSINMIKYYELYYHKNNKMQMYLWLAKSYKIAKAIEKNIIVNSLPEIDITPEMLNDCVIKDIHHKTIFKVSKEIVYSRAKKLDITKNQRDYFRNIINNSLLKYSSKIAINRIIARGQFMIQKEKYELASMLIGFGNIYKQLFEAKKKPKEKTEEKTKEKEDKNDK